MSDRHDQTTAPRRMGNPRFAALQEKIDQGNGLLAREWDWWDETFRSLDSEDYAAYRANVRRARILDDARKTLTADDLRALLAEKEMSP